MKRCCGVNHKHPSAESEIWLSNTTEKINSPQMDVYTRIFFGEVKRPKEPPARSLLVFSYLWSLMFTNSHAL